MTAHADHTCDISDVYMEIHDPDNEFGIYAEALFALKQDARPVVDDWEYINSNIDLIGISLEDQYGSQFLNREQAMEVLGYDAVTRIERLEREAVLQ